MGTVKVQIVKWGNSHAVRLPKAVLEKARLRDGDHLEVRVENGRIALQPATPKLNLRDLVVGINRKNRYEEQNWGRPAGREVW